VPAGQPVLIMIQGPEPGSFYRLPDNRVTTIGRSSRNALRLVTPTVSRFHCEVACVNGEWQVTDLNSKKGTLVNGERIVDSCVLKPGDLIRLSTTVFRFDIIEESALCDSALLAIKEAELGAELDVAGEAKGALEDIRLRSRLEREGPADGRPRSRKSLAVNLALLAGATMAAGALVAGASLYPCGRNGLVSPEPAPLEPPGRTAAGAAWTAVQQTLSAVAAREAEGDYAGAIALYDEAQRRNLARGASGLLRRRRQYTVRLAHAWFKRVREEAGKLEGRGDLRSALRLYRECAARVGLPELAAEASRKVSELEKLVGS